MANEPVNIGPTRGLKLGDLSERHRLRAACSKCRHVALIEPGWLRKQKRGRLKHFHRGHSMTDAVLDGVIATMAIDDLAQWLRCRGCGNRLGNALTVVKLPRNA